ncbi:MAG: PIN domain-containing protein [bacterium]|nr:PIN domain-containing protein [bacterium]
MQGNRYFLDTNIFLRFVVKDDVAMAKDCERLFERIQEGTLRATTSKLVLAEFVWTCLSFYKLKKEDVVELLGGIVAMSYLSIKDGGDFFQALELYQGNSVKFIDTLIAAQVLEIKNGVVVSYDKEFEKLKVRRVEPKDV